MMKVGMGIMVPSMEPFSQRIGLVIRMRLIISRAVDAEQG